MTIITYNTTPTTTESDGTSTDWKQVPMTGYHVFPYSTAFLLGDINWALEFYVIPGRYKDMLNCSLLKQTTTGFQAVYDWSIKTGIEYVIDNTIRIFGLGIKANILDNYETKKVYGLYNVAVSEVI